MDDVNEFLEHYGVKGMQWGVRKDRKAIKDAARTQEYMVKYGLPQDKAQRRQRREKTNQKNAQKAVGKFVGITSLKVVGSLLVRDIIRQAAAPGQFKPAASSKLIVRLGATSYRAAASAVKGAKLLFEPNMTYFDPGTGPAPGTYTNAARLINELPPVRKALNP